MMQHIKIPKQNWLWYLTKFTPVHPFVSNVNSKYNNKTANNYQLEHNMCLSILRIYILYGSSFPHQRSWSGFALPWISTFDEQNGTWTSFCDEKITKYKLLNTITKATWPNNPNHNGWHNSAMECQRSAISLMSYACRKQNWSTSHPWVTTDVPTMTATTNRWGGIQTSCQVQESSSTSRKDSTWGWLGLTRTSMR